MNVPAEVMAIIDNGRAYVVPEDVAKVLHISGDTVRASAREGKLEFPVMISGTRVRIPKLPFLRWLGYDI